MATVTRNLRVQLAVYGFVLALIAFWPSPVDQGAGPILHSITAAVPWLTYSVIEFSANVVLFVPLGAILSLALPSRRKWVVPIALAVTILIEVGQALLLTQRTPSVRDVIANTLGAAIGLLAVVVIERIRRGIPHNSQEPQNPRS